MNEFTRDLNELKNLYSNPASSLNRVLDSLIRKVQDIEGYMAQRDSQSYQQRSERKIKVSDFNPHQVLPSKSFVMTGESLPDNARELSIHDDILSHSQPSHHSLTSTAKKRTSIQLSGMMQMGEPK